LSKALYYCAASLDGYIAESDDTLAWLMDYRGSFEGSGVEPMKGSYDRFYEGVGALVMGSATYKFILEHEGKGDTWPYGGKPVWVLTSRELPRHSAPDADIRFANAEIDSLYEEMLATAGADHLWVVGGGNVASQFADRGLLDEVLVTVVPVVLGSGKPLFDRRVPGGPLQLVGTRTFDTGMVELHYEISRKRGILSA
jgi:dihydrofolate reductase